MEEINVQLLNMGTKIPEQLIKNDDDIYKCPIITGKPAKILLPCPKAHFRQ